MPELTVEYVGHAFLLFALHLYSERFNIRCKISGRPHATRCSIDALNTSIEQIDDCCRTTANSIISLGDGHIARCHKFRWRHACNTGRRDTRRKSTDSVYCLILLLGLCHNSVFNAYNFWKWGRVAQWNTFCAHCCRRVLYSRKPNFLPIKKTADIKRFPHISSSHSAMPCLLFSEFNEIARL